MIMNLYIAKTIEEYSKVFYKENGSKIQFLSRKLYGRYDPSTPT